MIDEKEEEEDVDSGWDLGLGGADRAPSPSAKRATGPRVPSPPRGAAAAPIPEASAAASAPSASPSPPTASSAGRPSGSPTALRKPPRNLSDGPAVRSVLDAIAAADRVPPSPADIEEAVGLALDNLEGLESKPKKAAAGSTIKDEDTPPVDVPVGKLAVEDDQGDGPIEDLAATVEAPKLTREALEKLLASSAADGAPASEGESKSGPSPTSSAPTVRGGVDSTTRRMATPPAGVLAASEGDEPEDREPPTRRASDEEIAKNRTTPTGPPMKLAGRRATPLLSNAADEARRADARFHSRPTPRATAVATTALRFPAGSLVDARNRRKTTKINLQTIDIAREAEAYLRGIDPEAPAAGRSETPERKGAPHKPPSMPVLDLHLDLDAAMAPGIEDEAERGPETARAPTDASTAKTAPAMPAARQSAIARAAMRDAEVAGSRAREASRPGGLRPPTPPASSQRGAAPRPAPSGPGGARITEPSRADIGVSPLAQTFDGDGDVHLDLAEAELSEEEVEAIKSEPPISGLMPDPFAPKPVIAIGAPPAASRVGSLATLDEPGAESAKAAGGSGVETPRTVEDPELTPIRIRFERGDYLGALLRAEALLEARPDFEHARRYVESAQELLRQMYLEKLGSGDQVLRVTMDPSDIQGLALDHRSGFLISLIDGVATIDEILDISGMPPLDALRLLFEMRQQGVVAVDSLARP